MTRDWLSNPIGFDPYNSWNNGWTWDRSEMTLSQMKALLMPLPWVVDQIVPPPKVMDEYPLL